MKLMAPQYVQPYVKTNKNERRDAEAIAEAVTRRSRRLGPIKEVEPPALQAWHRVRARLMGARTALVNARRGRLAEYGIVVPPGGNAFRKAVRAKRDAAHAKRTALSRERFSTRFDELVKLEAALADSDDPREALAHRHPECQRLLPIPGIGPSTATARIAAVSDVGVFTHGRHFAAWLGLVPKQHATGGQTRL